MSKKQELIKVEPYAGNDSVRDYHTRAKLIKDKPDSSRAGTLGPVGKALYDIPGVASVEVDLTVSLWREAKCSPGLKWNRASRKYCCP